MQQVIICVDDEKSIACGLQQQISRAFPGNYLIEIAESGEEALEIIEEIKEAGMKLFMVITDQIMPGMKGMELIQTIRDLSAATKCILLTGYLDETIFEKNQTADVFKILKKPWEFEDIKNAIEEADYPQQANPNIEQIVIK